MVVLAAVAALLVSAFAADGYDTPELELHDAGIWISWEGGEHPAVGRINTQIEDIDARLLVEGLGSFELLQHDAVVLLHVGGTEGDSLVTVDPATASSGAPLALPPSSSFELNGPGGGLAPTAAVLDTAGNLWIADATAIAGLDFEVGDDGEAAGAITVPGGTEVAVGTDGYVHVLSKDTGEITSFDPQGQPAGTRSVDPIAGGAVQLSTVGPTPMALDIEGNRLLIPGVDPVDLAGIGDVPELQLAGPVADQVVVATEEGMFAVPLDGGTAEPLFDGGSAGATRPLVLGECAYGAWSATPSWAQRCGDDLRNGDLGTIDPDQALRIRTNRGRVVFNATESGQAMLFDDGEVVELSWQNAEGPTEEPSDEPPDETTEQEDEQEEQLPPELVDDIGDEAFATRPGRTVVVHPLRNDTDPNGDVLTITNVTDPTGGAEAVIVDGGTAVQVVPSNEDTVTITFTYTAWDGHTDPQTADVEVEVHPFTENEPPFVPDQESFTRSGRPISHNVLAWPGVEDPDGDSMQLVVPVAIDPAFGAVTSEANGTINFTPPGEGFVGDVVIEFSVIDDAPIAVQETVTATLTVHVRDVNDTQSNQPPVGTGDHAETVVGRPVTIDVLANDTDADGDPLRVVNVGQLTGATFEIDQSSGDITVTPTASGPLSTEYTVTDGFAPVEVPLRVDVVAAPEQQPPVAVRDDVILRPGTPSFVDVLANDFDPNGDILVVTAVSVPEGSNLRIQIVDHRFLSIDARAGLLGEATAFTYSISDGGEPVDGTVLVRPIPPSTAEQPPVALPDDVSVRAGNVGTFDVLANDRDPEGGRLDLVLATVPEAFIGNVFVQAGLLRFVAPAEAQTITIAYQAVDPTGRSAAGSVVVHVLERELSNNGPQPPAITARTVAGQDVSIPIPVGSMDPDGDAVVVLGVGDDPPLHGSVVLVEADRLVYRPDRFEGGFYGTDRFTYRVRDSRGAEASSTVDVGVAPPADFNTPPTAVPDSTQVPLAGEVRIAVTRNDSDPERDTLVLESELAFPAEHLWEAEVDGTEVVFRANDAPAGDIAVFSYTISDGILEDRGTVSVRVAGEDGLPPIALDDVGGPGAAGDVVTVAVVPNDSDPDGSDDELRVIDVVDPSGATTPTHDEASVTATVVDGPVTLVYTIEDRDGDRARAVVRIAFESAEERRRPRANYDEATTDQNEAVVVDVTENDRSDTDTLEIEGVEGTRGGTCEPEGTGSVRFTPVPDFYGTGGCTYVLRDGPGDDPDTKRSVGMVGITVVRTDNTPPTFREQPLSLGAEETIEVDLLPAVEDPDRGDLDRIEFSEVEVEGQAIEVEFNGTVIQITAARNAGDVMVPVTFTVSDEAGGEAPGRVLVTVSRFSGALAVPVPDVWEMFQEDPGVPEPVLANDRPAEGDSRLSIESLDQAIFGGSATHDATTITFSPEPGYHGSTSFNYVVNDGTDDPERFVTGTATVTVIGRPDRPAAPAVERGDEQITLAWGVPADNGAPITGYAIRANGGSPLFSPTNAFTYTGLTNGQQYEFEIAAINSAVEAHVARGGDYEYGPASPRIRPNLIPPVPNAPVATFDPAGNAITVVWTDPGGRGTPVERYVLEVSPPGTSGDGDDGRIELSGRSSTQVRVDGLTNGTAYTFRVEAYNTIDDGLAGPSGFSAYSAPEIPAKAPDVMAQPTIADEGDGSITVQWVEPATNGDAISSYDIEVSRNGAVQGTVRISDPTIRQHTITSDNGSEFTFRILATNKAGASAYSPSSAVGSSFGPPFATGAVSATEGNTDSTLSFTDPPDNGRPISGYEYRFATNGSGAFGGWATLATNRRVGGLANGTSYVFQVRACNQRGCSPDPSQSSNSVRPYGPAPQPNVSRTGSGNTIGWSWSETGTGGGTFARWEYSLNGGPFQNAGSSTSVGGTDYGCGSSSSISVRMITTGGHGEEVGSQRSASANTNACPQPTVTVSRGGSAQGQTGCSSSECSYLVVSWSDLPNRAHSYTCNTATGGAFYSRTTNPLPSGSNGSGYELFCYADASVFGGVYVVLDGVTSNTANW